MGHGQSEEDSHYFSLKTVFNLVEQSYVGLFIALCCLMFSFHRQELNSCAVYLSRELNESKKFAGYL